MNPYVEYRMGDEWQTADLDQWELDIKPDRRCILYVGLAWDYKRMHAQHDWRVVLPGGRVLAQGSASNISMGSLSDPSATTPRKRLGQ